ncbi:DNA polymerase IV [Pandoraea nosoerga]|uniref:DNA polymerase IV n=1 Tax=Pandoraea nosoerga TaxID=2508296 RepID=A0A5E4TKK3_9BURK|nr:DNA polymerase IV [Pandoraea nosoerga]MBN4665544.1 DNA polymerase IV [Pandoraea nosoerga]MBN4675069.1 DNA polymerase IV [Pandoraea nosoerga]MBN4680385.1 DNA polymerase IV [Pandoraea nosoerga]MBN4745537.1 DNA polymerase IV [Pandoraea nosoerga]VVD88385.1 DNA polymerase IV [Pandoraea nosoerga]
MSTTTRKIIHCDADCFYASVEMRDNPSLRGIPLAVGGQPDQRGVVATCNYEARAFGVRSAMPSAQALKLCPSLHIIPPSMDRYREASQRIMAIYRDYTELVEPLSLDEAYLDVTLSERCEGSATLIAREIRARVAAEVGLTVSAGVAPNKFIAKIASDWRKPDGMFVVRPAEVDAFVAALPVERLFGVGKVTAEKLRALGVDSCGDLRRHSMTELIERFGVFGQRLYERCRGIDTREVSPERERKSISVETTYTRDLRTLADCATALEPLLHQLAQRIERARRSEPLAVAKVFVKIRFADFSRTTAEAGALGVDPAQCHQLLAQAVGRRRKPVRLLGVGVRLLEAQATRQLRLFDDWDGGASLGRAGAGDNETSQT